MSPGALTILSRFRTNHLAELTQGIINLNDHFT
jgi:hypothetical protein